jgi:hypothetical protein
VASELRRKACNRHEQLAPDAAAPDAAAQSNGLDVLERRDQLAAVLRALDKLDADKREVLVLYDLLELPMKQVASRLGCPLKTAFSRLYAGRRQVLAELRERSPLLGFWFALRPLHEGLAAPAPGAATLARSWPLHASIAVLAGVCAIVPATPPSASPPLTLAHATRSLRMQPRAAAHMLTGPVEMPAVKPARVMAAPSRAKPALDPKQIAHAPKISTLAPNTTATPTEPGTAPQSQTAPALDDFTIVHASAVDTRPQIQSPLALSLVPAPRHAARIRLDGPREPADAIEAALLDESVRAR